MVDAINILLIFLYVLPVTLVLVKGNILWLYIEIIAAGSVIIDPLVSTDDVIAISNSIMAEYLKYAHYWMYKLVYALHITHLLQ